MGKKQNRLNIVISTEDDKRINNSNNNDTNKARESCRVFAILKERERKNRCTATKDKHRRCVRFEYLLLYTPIYFTVSRIRVTTRGFLF